jgi:hypothetical protein
MSNSLSNYKYHIKNILQEMEYSVRTKMGKEVRRTLQDKTNLMYQERGTPSHFF